MAQPIQCTSSLEYEPAWQLPAAIVDAEGNRAEVLYTNALPLVVKEFYSASNSYDTGFSYTTNGLVESITNANEHVTMQIASQVFGIETPPNAVVRFTDGELAYIVKRFDRRNGQKIGHP